MTARAVMLLCTTKRDAQTSLPGLTGEVRRKEKVVSPVPAWKVELSQRLMFHTVQRKLRQSILYFKIHNTLSNVTKRQIQILARHIAIQIQDTQRVSEIVSHMYLQYCPALDRTQRHTKPFYYEFMNKSLYYND